MGTITLSTRKALDIEEALENILNIAGKFNNGDTWFDVKAIEDEVKLIAGILGL